MDGQIDGQPYTFKESKTLICPTWESYKLNSVRETLRWEVLYRTINGFKEHLCGLTLHILSVHPCTLNKNASLVCSSKKTLTYLMQNSKVLPSSKQNLNI